MRSTQALAGPADAGSPASSSSPSALSAALQEGLGLVSAAAVSVAAAVSAAVDSSHPATDAQALQPPPLVIAVRAGSRAKFPLSFGHATEYVRHRSVVIGDAAHKVHPLAGQGANLGLADAACLAMHLDECLAGGGDLGNPVHLRAYERERQRAVLPMLAGIELVHRLFTTSNSAVAGMRGIGLSATDAMGLLKHRIMKYAML